jgi:H2-forming N5,N10-methylenetetrahydromethanopterin dehydrogenase-like enzyme
MRHLLIETKNAGEGFLRSAAVLAGAGHPVVLALLQDGVAADRALLAGLATAGVTVLADDFSLSQRAVAPSDAVTVVDVDRLAELVLADDVRVVWH